MKYTAKGEYKKSGSKEKFTKEVDAENEKMAKEKLYAEMGSKQGVKRHDIAIAEIKVHK